MGVDAMRRMVAPRVLAITLLMPALGLLVIFVEYYAIELAYLVYGGHSGAFKDAAAYSYSRDRHLHLLHQDAGGRLHRRDRLLLTRG